MPTTLIKSILVSGLLTLSACAPSLEQGNQVNVNGAAIMGGELVSSSDSVASSTVNLLSQTQYNDGKFEVFRCTGSLLANNYVVTAAHCIPDVAENIKKQEFYVLFGLDQAKPTAANARIISGVAVHPQYKPNAKGTEQMHDIAVIKYEGATPKGFKPAELLQDITAIQEGAEMIAAGYGVNQSDGVNTKNSYKLNKVKLKILGPMNSTEAVAKQHKNVGVCHGDSGGPAFLEQNGKLLLWGVTSRVQGSYDGKNAIDDCAELSMFTAILPYFYDFIMPAINTLKAGPKKKVAVRNTP